MSEYQYYEFLAIDRPLTEREMGQLRNISTRAQITPTSFVNHYEWGDLKARPIAMMEKYFDAFVYVANWGTREFILRVPRRILDPNSLSLYKAGHALSFEAKGEDVIIVFRSDQEPENDWESGEGRLSSLVPLRADLLDGDARCLYLGWLLGAQLGEVKVGSLEPPVPAGLAKLSAPLKGLAEFLRVDQDLIEAAAQASDALHVESPEEGELDRWIGALPASEKDGLLVRLARGEDRHVRADLLQRFRHSRRRDRTVPEGKRRSAKELLAAAEERSGVRRRAAAEREARERARREEEAAAARSKYLAGLANRQEEVWQQIDALIATKQPQKYDQAVTFLKDLHELAAQSAQQDAYRRRLADLRERHARKPSLIGRIEKL
jgi:hypothetical protein